jgi:hypothetical protein
MKVTAQQYGEICDVVERTYYGMPLTGGDDPYLHTSAGARAAANRIIEILGLETEDPREISR